MLLISIDVLNYFGFFQLMFTARRRLIVLFSMLFFRACSAHKGRGRYKCGCYPRKRDDATPNPSILLGDAHELVCVLELRVNVVVTGASVLCWGEVISMGVTHRKQG